MQECALKNIELDFQKALSNKTTKVRDASGECDRIKKCE